MEPMELFWNHFSRIDQQASAGFHQETAKEATSTEFDISSSSPSEDYLTFHLHRNHLCL
jgi:hypothetical protein